MTRYLSLAEFLWLAEQVTGLDTTTLTKASRIDLADSALHAHRQASAIKTSIPTRTTKQPSSRADLRGTIRSPTATNAPRGRA